jgi:D-arabinose 1-dehydrogenase-like Zn-dependent alcohol dehydrogenase
MRSYQGRSWQAATFGAPQDVLRLKNVTWSSLTKGQLLVKVYACGVGLSDLLTKSCILTAMKPPSNVFR